MSGGGKAWNTVYYCIEDATNKYTKIYSPTNYGSSNMKMRQWLDLKRMVRLGVEGIEELEGEKKMGIEETRSTKFTSWLINLMKINEN